MTEKRFTDVCGCETGHIIFTDNGIDKELTASEFEDLLNKLHKENQYLRSLKWIQDCINEISIGMQQRQSLEKENEQLKYNYNEKCNEYCGLEEQVDILLKENEKLKSDVYDWKASAEDYLKLGKSLKKENEQLKSEYKVLHTQYHDLKKFVENNFDEYLTQKKLNRQIVKLSDENKELKRELQTYRKLVGCFNCRYHNYDWFDDGDEFEVCDKGNDVTDGICKDWEEIE